MVQQIALHICHVCASLSNSLCGSRGEWEELRRWERTIAPAFHCSNATTAAMRCLSSDTPYYTHSSLTSALPGGQLCQRAECFAASLERNPFALFFILFYYYCRDKLIYLRSFTLQQCTVYNAREEFRINSLCVTHPRRYGNGMDLLKWRANRRWSKWEKKMPSTKSNYKFLGGIIFSINEAIRAQKYPAAALATTQCGI